MIPRIDPEFEALIPPLSGAERERLRASLAAEGCRDPILVWKEPKQRTPVVVDGHNRFRLCAELGIRMPPPREMQFTNREAVRTWILANQIARRNLSPDQIVMLHIARGVEPPCCTPSQSRNAHWLLGRPEAMQRVISGEWSLQIAANETKPRTPRQPTGPRVNPDRGSGSDPVVTVGRVSVPHPTLSPTDLAAARARADAQRAASDVRELQKKLLEYERAQEFYDSIAAAKPITLNASRPKSGKRQGVIHTVLSDWHVGEIVSTEETHGTNAYNIAIARERATRFWDNILWLRKDIGRTVESPDHVLNLNGDLISGSIHPELGETNACLLTEQVAEVCAMIEPGIRALSKATPGRLIIPCTHGNHGRFTEKSRIKSGWGNSLETMAYAQLRTATRDLENVEWLIPKAESIKHTVFGYRMRYQHGTHIRSGGGIGGILVPLMRWATRVNDADYYVFGHFHQACAFAKIVVNGSLIGQSAYSAEMGFEFRPPEQVNFVIDEKHGLRRFDPVSVT